MVWKIRVGGSGHPELLNGVLHSSQPYKEKKVDALAEIKIIKKALDFSLDSLQIGNSKLINIVVLIDENAGIISKPFFIPNTSCVKFAKEAGLI
jgi:hypothetical protein